VMYMGPDLKAKDILKKLRDAKTARVSQEALDAAKPPSDSAKLVVSGNGDPFGKTGISNITTKPGDSAASERADGNASVKDGYESVKLETLFGSQSPYPNALSRAKSALEDLNDSGYFSEHELNWVQVNFLIESDGTPSVEVVHPKDLTRDTTYSIERMIIDRMERALPEKVEPPSLKGNGMRLVYPPVSVNPCFWELDVVPKGPDGEPNTNDTKNTKMLQLELRKVLNMHSHKLQEKGVDIVRIQLELKKARCVVVRSIEPAAAREILGNELAAKLKEFSAAFSDAKSPMLYPKTKDVLWPFEHKVERTWHAKLPSEGPAPIAVVKAIASPNPLVAVEAAVAAAQAERPVAARGMIETPSAQSSGTTKIIKIGEDLIIQHKEISRRFAIYDVCKLNADGKSEVVGSIEIPVEKKGEKKIIKDKSGKAFEVALRMRENGELEMDENGLEPVLDIAPAPVRKPSYRNEVEAAIVGTIATGSFFAMLPKAIEILKFYALNIPYVGNFMYSINVPDQVNILGQTISSSALISGVAVVSGITSAILVGLGLRSKKKQGDKQ